MAQRKGRRKSRTSRQSAVAGDGTISLLRGPSKARLPGSTKAKTSRHKRRVAWFGARVTWPLREAPLLTLERERARAGRALPGGPAWPSAGPCRSDQHRRPLHRAGVRSGRSRPRVDRRGGRRRLASTDAGQSWAQVARQGPLQIGSLAIDPATPRRSTAAPARRTCRPTRIRATASTGRPTAAPRGSRGRVRQTTGCRAHRRDRGRSVRLQARPASAASATAGCRRQRLRRPVRTRDGGRPGSG